MNDEKTGSYYFQQRQSGERAGLIVAALFLPGLCLYLKFIAGEPFPLAAWIFMGVVWLHFLLFVYAVSSDSQGGASIIVTVDAEALRLSRGPRASAESRIVPAAEISAFRYEKVGKADKATACRVTGTPHRQTWLIYGAESVLIELRSGDTIRIVTPRSRALVWALRDQQAHAPLPDIPSANRISRRRTPVVPAARPGHFTALFIASVLSAGLLTVALWDARFGGTLALLPLWQRVLILAVAWLTVYGSRRFNGSRGVAG